MVTSQRDFTTGGRNAEDTFYELAKQIGERCVENDGGHINVGELSGVNKKDGERKNCGKHGDLDLRMWVFDRFTSILEYKTKLRGVELVEVSEKDTSKTCCACGKKDDGQC